MENNTNPKIGIILLNYCNYQYTINCIDSLKQIEYENYIIIVVDNCSPNGSLVKLKEYASNNTFIIESEKNGGFAYGNNLGIEVAIKNLCDFVLLLNTDTTVDKNIINELLACCRYTGNLGIATARIMYSNEPSTVWYAGGDIDWKNGRAIHHSINEVYSKIKDNCEIRKVGFATGCCMLIPIEIFLNYTKLPEDYFMYYEDLDFCISIKDLGKDILYNPNAIVYHNVSGTGGGKKSPFVIEWSNRSRRLFMKKYSNRLCWRNRILYQITCEIREIVIILLSPKRKQGICAYIKSFTRTSN